jgi:pimeloyl-ACP methyl ester carboxylesterase
MLASERPDVVKSLVVMPAGPTSWPLPALPPEIREATQKQRSIRITDEKTFEEACRLMRTMVFSSKTPESLVHEYITGLLKQFTAADGSAYRAWGDRRPPWDMATTGAGKWIQGGTAPILGIHGLDDRTVPPELGRQWQKTLGHRARLVEVPDAGHVLMVEQPHAVAKAILAFYLSLP